MASSPISYIGDIGSKTCEVNSKFAGQTAEIMIQYRHTLRSDGILPRKNQQMLDAAKQAWVFGVMGSWSDSPLDAAEEKGLKFALPAMESELVDQRL